MPSKKFDGLDAKQAAAVILPKTVTTSRGDNQFNPAQMLFVALIIFGVPAFYIAQVNATIEGSRKVYNERATARAMGTVYYTGGTALPTATAPGFMSVYSTPAPTVTPGAPVEDLPTLAPSPSPTLTETPTPAPTARAEGVFYAFNYSYYWPPYGPPNCGAENWDEKHGLCKDMTASGEQWTQHIGEGVAVPIQYKDEIPLLSTIRILSPLQLVGDYLVIDYCGGCVKPEGHIYLDFLDNRARANWTVPVLAQVIK